MLHSGHDFRRKLDTRNVEALPDLVGVLVETHGEVKAGDSEPELLLFFLRCTIVICSRMTFLDENILHAYISVCDAHGGELLEDLCNHLDPSGDRFDSNA